MFVCPLKPGSPYGGGTTRHGFAVPVRLLLNSCCYEKCLTCNKYTLAEFTDSRQQLERSFRLLTLQWSLVHHLTQTYDAIQAVIWRKPLPFPGHLNIQMLYRELP